MDGMLRRRLLSYVAGAAISLSTGGVARARSQLEEIPGPIMADLLGDVAGEEWHSKELVSLLEVMAEDNRVEVRRRTAELLKGLIFKAPPMDLEPLMSKLTRDRDPVVRKDMAESLVAWMARVDGLTRTRLVSEWTLGDGLGSADVGGGVGSRAECRGSGLCLGASQYRHQRGGSGNSCTSSREALQPQPRALQQHPSASVLGRPPLGQEGCPRCSGRSVPRRLTERELNAIGEEDTDR